MRETKVLIRDQKNFSFLKEKIRSEGVKKLHILSDFDKTLTYAEINGIKTPSLISMLRDGKHLTKNYAEKAHALYNKYHPYEVDPKISFYEKKRLMQKWWEEHMELLLESGLSKKDLEDIIENGPVRFREGVCEFLDILYENNIPLVIISSSSIGDAIPMFFKKYDRNYSNIYYITNLFNWDENGKAISLKTPLIHSMNKDEATVKKFPEIYKVIKNRKNVILLGDVVEDVLMIKGFDYKHLLKIGFLNSEFESLREEYTKNFDVVIEGDGDFYYVNNLMKEIINKE
ncbi:MAG: hypothetical protein QXU20_00605 [Candidatus Woesearchaeota archaeon]